MFFCLFCTLDFSCHQQNLYYAFAKLSENAFPPLKGSAYAAGWDLRRSVLNFLILFKK